MHDPAPDAQPDNEVNQEEFRFAIREAEPADHDFVANSWRRSYDMNGANPNCRCPGGVDEYIRTQNAVIETCLATSRVLVAHPEHPQRRPEQILGWVCYRGPVIHYVYVKAPFRRMGLAKDLLRTALAPRLTGNIYLSHWAIRRGPAVEQLRVLAVQAGYLMHYNPALVFGGEA